MRFITVFFMMLMLVAPAVAADPVTDDHLYDQVRLRLANDREIGGSPIEVKVTEGVVELTGKVKSDKHKTRAEKIAKKVKGVKSVVNNLTVAPV